MALTQVQSGMLNADSQNYGFKNRIINGGMVVNQYGTGSSAGNGMAVDRFKNPVSQAAKLTVQQNAGSVTPPAGFTNYYGMTSSSAYSVISTDYFLIGQSIEGLNITDLGWGTANAQTVTLSFWVRSSLTGTFGGSLQNSAQTRTYPYSYTISSANTWEYKTVTIAGDTSGTWLTTNGVGVTLWFSLGVGSINQGTANAWAGSSVLAPTGSVSVVGTNGATFYITGVQLEKGSTATSFDYRPFGAELALCQRYAQPCGQGGTGRASSSTGLETTTQFRVPMRATPTITFGGFSGAQTEISQFGIGSVTVSAVSNSGFASATGSYLSYTTTGATSASFVACIKGDTSFANAEL